MFDTKHGFILSFFISISQTNGESLCLHIGISSDFAHWNVFIWAHKQSICRKWVPNCKFICFCLTDFYRIFVRHCAVFYEFFTSPSSNPKAITAFRISFIWLIFFRFGLPILGSYVPNWSSPHPVGRVNVAPSPGSAPCRPPQVHQPAQRSRQSLLSLVVWPDNSKMGEKLQLSLKATFRALRYPGMYNSIVENC